MGAACPAQQEPKRVGIGGTCPKQKGIPKPFVVNETWTDDSKLLNDQRFEALVPQLARSRFINSKQEPVSRI